MREILNKKIIRSLKSLLIIFPISILLYLFLSEYWGKQNFIYLIQDLYAEVLLGLILITCGYLIRYYRWRMIIRNLGLNPGIKMDFILWLSSYAFTATPGKIGELIRCFFLKKIFNIKISYSLISIIIERFFDFFAVIIFAFLFFILNLRGIIKTFKNDSLILFIILSILFALYFLIKNYKKIFRLVLNLKFRFNNLDIKFRDLVFIEGFKEFLKLKLLFRISSLSLLSWGLEGFIFYILLRNSDVSISLITAVFIHTSSGLLGALTMLPGGLVSTEALTISLLKFQSISLPASIGLTTLMRTMTLWYASILGIFSLFIIRKKIFS